MGVPKGKMSKSNKRQRRGEDKLKMPGLSTCPQCHSLKRPHQVCPECVYYKGQEVVKAAAK